MHFASLDKKYIVKFDTHKRFKSLRVVITMFVSILLLDLISFQKPLSLMFFLYVFGLIDQFPFEATF